MTTEIEQMVQAIKLLEKHDMVVVQRSMMEEAKRLIGSLHWMFDDWSKVEHVLHGLDGIKVGERTL